MRGLRWWCVGSPLRLIPFRDVVVNGVFPVSALEVGRFREIQSAPCLRTCTSWKWLCGKCAHSLKANFSAQPSVPALFASTRVCSSEIGRKLHQTRNHEWLSRTTGKGTSRNVYSVDRSQGKPASGARFVKFDIEEGIKKPDEDNFRVKSILQEVGERHSGVSVEAATAFSEKDVVQLRSASEPSFVLFASPTVPARLKHVRRRRIAAQALALSEKKSDEGGATSDAACGIGAIGLRVEVGGGGCSGYQYKYQVVSLEEAEDSRDIVFLPPSDPAVPTAPSSGSQALTTAAESQSENSFVNSFSATPDESLLQWFVCLPRPSLAFVESGSTIVFQESLTGSTFTVQGNRKAVSSCSCGVSFGVEETF